MDLGARPVRVFFDITLPIIAPALVAGWLLAFTLSLDDLVMASFVTGPGRLDAADGDLLQGAARGQPRHQRARDHHHRRRRARGRHRRLADAPERAPWLSAGDGAFRAAGPREHWAEMTYGGALSFLRRRYTRDLAGVDVAVMGFPYDAAVTYRPGCRLGPRAIRAASVQLAELKAFPWGFDLLGGAGGGRPRRRHARPASPGDGGAGDRGGGGGGDRLRREAAGARRRPFHRLAAACARMPRNTGRWR